jgi:hypothetical protein
MYDPLEKPYDELQKVMQSFVKKGNEVIMNQNNASSSDAAAALRQHKASESPAGGGPSTTTQQPTQAQPSSSTPSIASSSSDPITTAGKEEEDLVDAPMPQTFDEAMNRLNKLKNMRDDLLAEQDRNNKFVERYKAKVDKQERMATLHNLIPRQLFIREDRYNEELEKVYKWSGISDQEIADIYRRKLGDNSTNFKHHGASIINNNDPYRNFREVPDFSKVGGGKSLSSFNNNTNVILRNLEFMKKIASGRNS